MKKTFNFIRLDFKSIKPYLASPRLYLFFFVALLTGVVNKTPMVSVAMILFIIMSFATYPFAAADQDNLDILYSSLGYKRKDVVKGRYMTMLVIYVTAIIIETVMYVTVSLLIQSSISLLDLMFLNITLRLLMIITQAFQFSIYFKDGYLKSKTSTYLPYIIILLGSMLFFYIINLFQIEVSSLSQFTSMNPLLLIFILISVGILIIFISYKKSLVTYSKREF